MKIKTMMVVSALMFFSASAAMAKGPCKELAKRCEAAGYKPGDHKNSNNGVWVDCVAKILKGEATSRPVDASGISDADKAACKTKLESKIAERKAQKAAKNKQ